MAAADDPLPLAPAEILPASWRGNEGHFRVAQDVTGRWSLFDPDGRLFFCRAVNGVRVARPENDVPLPADAAGRLRAWGFNTLGLGADESLRADGFPFLASVDFISAGPAIVGPGLRLPDVFSSDWPRLAALHAGEKCRPLAGEVQLIGWAADDGLGWAQSGGAGRPTLLQHCLSLEPGFAAYHAAWEFVLALHGGRMEAIARAWGVAITNKEVVREMTREEIGIATRGYGRDEVRWTREFARRYFNATSAAIREADPNHLVLGCRSVGPAGVHVLAESVYPALDVTMRDWRDLPATAATPMLAVEVTWTEPEFARAGSVRDRALTSIERMLRRGRTALDRVARHPAAVGYVWSQWQDDPGEQPPFGRGLVHGNGIEAREHTELLTSFNARAESLRRTATKLPPS